MSNITIARILTFVIAMIAALPFQASAASKRCLEIIETVSPKSPDKIKMLACNDPILDKAELTLQAVLQRHEARKSTLIGFAHVKSQYFEIISRQKKITAEWDAIFSKCGQGPLSRSACADLELNIPALRWDFQSELSQFVNKLSTICDKKESAASDEQRLRICSSVKGSLNRITEVWLKHLDERYRSLQVKQ